MFLAKGNMDGYIDGTSTILDTETGIVIEANHIGCYEPAEEGGTVLTKIQGP